MYLAISGKSPTEIYVLAKNEIQLKKKTNSRLSGYIAKEDYENKSLKSSENIKTDSSVTTFSFSQFGKQSQNEPQDPDTSAMKGLSIQHNPSLQNSSSKNNVTSAALRENLDSNSAGKMSAQKNFTGRDQSNISPYSSVEKNTSGRKAIGFSQNSCGGSTPSTFKVKRQISFDN